MARAPVSDMVGCYPDHELERVPCPHGTTAGSASGSSGPTGPGGGRARQPISNSPEGRQLGTHGPVRWRAQRWPANYVHLVQDVYVLSLGRLVGES
jgi:hypothetical protein